MAPPKNAKLKYFKCPKCSNVETQDKWVVAMEHKHGEKIYRCEEVKNERGEPMGGQGPKRADRLVDGTTGRAIV